MALGLLTAIAGINSGILLIIFFFIQLNFELRELKCKHVFSQLMALGLLIATTGTGSGFFHVIFFFHKSLELTIRLTVSM